MKNYQSFTFLCHFLIFSFILTYCNASVISLPGVLHFEDYRQGNNGVDYYDTSAGNFGNPSNNPDGCFPYQDADFDPCYDCNGRGCCLGYIEPGEWLLFDVNFRIGGYFAIKTRYAYPPGTLTGDKKTFSIYIDNAFFTRIELTPTGDWIAWSDAYTKTSQIISSGPHTIKFVSESSWLRLNFIEFAPQINLIDLPGTIKADEFKGGRNGIEYSDTTPGNLGNPNNDPNGCRVGTDVDTQPTADGRACSLDYIEDGEYVNYAVNFAGPESEYYITIRYAYPSGTPSGDEKKVKVFVNGVLEARIVVSPTGGWENWEHSVKVKSFHSIAEGPAEVTLAFGSSWWRIRAIEFSRA